MNPYLKNKAEYSDNIITIGMSDDERYEIHKERYSNPGSRVDTVYTFVSAFSNSADIIPVSFSIKIYTNSTASLYVTVTMHEIKRSRIVGYTPGEYSTEPYPLPASFELSLTDLLSNVNIEDKNFLKYIPDGFLTDVQKDAKKIALKEAADYIDKKNKRYLSKTDKSITGDAIVSESGAGYTEIGNDIVLCFCVSLTNLTGRQP